MSLSRAQIDQLIDLNVTDELNRQNTANKVRGVLHEINASSFNPADDSIQWGNINGNAEDNSSLVDFVQEQIDGIEGFLKLGGTDSGLPITGDVEVDTATRFFSSNGTNTSQIFFENTSIGIKNIGVDGYTELNILGGEITINSTILGFQGLQYAFDYSADFTDDSLINLGFANLTYQLLSEKDQPLGYASLDSFGKILATQIPAIAITDTFVVASEAAMLALSTAETGDVAVRTDENKSYILAGTSYSTLGDWQELLTPTGAVSSFNGRVGPVTLLSSDVTDALGFTPEEELGNPEGSTGYFLTSTTGGVRSWAEIDLTGFVPFDYNDSNDLSYVTTGNITLQGNTSIEIQSSGDVSIETSGLLLFGSSGTSFIDKVINLNYAGAAASGTNSGISIFEGGAATGYFHTNGAGTGWDLKATATAGIASFINNAASFTYTLPGATGTLALISDIVSTFSDSAFRVKDNGDATKLLAFETSGIDTATTRTLTVPNSNGTIALLSDISSSFIDNTFRIKDNADLTKILAFEVSGIDTATTRTLTAPNTSGTIALLSDITGSFTDSTFRIKDNGDPTKLLAFEVSAIDTATTRTLTTPNFDGTIATLSGTESFQNKTIGNNNTVTLKDTLFSLQDDGDATKLLTWQISGITTASNRTITMVDYSGTAVLSNGALTAARVPFYSAAGLVDSANMVYDGTTLRMDGAGTTSVGPFFASKSSTGIYQTRIANTNNGTGALVRMIVTNDALTTAGVFLYSSGFTPSNDAFANGTKLYADGAGGLSISAAHASGSIRFYTGNSTPVLRGTVLNTGGWSLIGLTVQDPTDTSKKITWDASGITTATTRTITLVDYSGTSVLSNGSLTASRIPVASAAGLVDFAGFTYNGVSLAISTGNINFSGATRSIGTTDANTFGIFTNTFTRFTVDSTGRFVFTKGSESGINTFITFNQPADTTQAAKGLLWTAGGHTTQLTTTEIIDINWNLSATLQHSTGAIATQRSFLIQARTYSFVGASTITTAATFAITGAPIQGTNATLTNSYALWIQGGTLALAAGIAAVNGAPLLFSSGVNLTTPINGAMEYNGSNLFFTRTGATREQVLTAFAVTTEAVISDTTVSFNYLGTTYKFLVKA